MSAARPLGGKAARLARSAGAAAEESLGVRKAARPKLVVPPPEAAPHERGVSKSRDVLRVPVGLIVRDDRQPRTEFDPDALARLGESLKAKGQLQACRVWLDERRGRYVLVAGERRWRAAQLAGLAALECKVVPRPTSAPGLLADQLAENCARADLTPLELGASVDRLIGKFGWSQARVARETGLSTSAVARALALRLLPEAIRRMIADGSLSATAGYELSKIADLPAKQLELARHAANGNMVHSRLAEVVRRLRDGGGLLASEPATAYVDPPAEEVAWEAASGGLPTKPPDPSATVDVATCNIQNPRCEPRGDAPLDAMGMVMPAGMPADTETGGGGAAAPSTPAGGPAGTQAPTPAPPTPIAPARGPAEWVTPFHSEDGHGVLRTYQLGSGVVTVRAFDPAGDVVRLLELAWLEAIRQADSARPPAAPAPAVAKVAYAVVPVVPRGRETPAYYVRAEHRGNAEAFVRRQHPEGYRFRLRPHDGDLPAGCVVYDAEVGS